MKYIGASNLSPQRLLASLEASEKMGLPRYETFQSEYNLYTREIFERELEKICTEHNLGVISYYSLTEGFLTGKFRSVSDATKSVRGESNKKYLDERGIRILEALDHESAKYNTSLASIAIAWLIARPTVAVQIASVTTLAQLDELVKSVQVVLDTDSINALNYASNWH